MLHQRLCLTFMAVMFSLGLARAGGTFTVTTTADAGPGSLRAAITAANADATATTVSPAVIEFSFSSGTAPFTITCASALPDITKPVNINGYQGSSAGTPGAIGSRTLRTVVAGSAITGDVFSISSTNVTIQGLVIQARATGWTAIGNRSAANPCGNLAISGCYINTDVSGTSSSTAVTVYGIYLLGTITSGLSNNRNIAIGGASSNSGNLINAQSLEAIRLDATGNVTVSNNVLGGLSANGNSLFPGTLATNGITMNGNSAGTYPVNTISNNTIGNMSGYGFIGFGAAFSNSLIANNLIGICKDGHTAAPLGSNGIALNGGGNGNTISGNVIGNSNYGIYMNASSQNMVKNNLVGICSDGITTAALTANSAAIYISAGSVSDTVYNNTVGNAGNGIYADGGSSLLVIDSNRIGLCNNGVTAAPNSGFGITLNPVARSIISRNIVVNTGSHGIYLVSGNRNTIDSNYVGLLQDGITGGAVANSGIVVTSDTNVITNNRVGFCRVYGIYLGSADSNLVGLKPNGQSAGNYVGIAADGISNAKNLNSGIYVESNSTYNTIANNFIGYNNGNGVVFTGSNTAYNIVRNNKIGVRADGVTAAPNNARGVELNGSTHHNKITGNTIRYNIGVGIYLNGSSNNQIGADSSLAAPDANTITNTAVSGIYLEASSQNNRISRNVFGNNTGKPIVLNSSHTNILVNDGTYPGTGGNGALDYPIITSYNVNPGVSVTLSGYIGNNVSGSSTFANMQVQVYRLANDRNQNGVVSNTVSTQRPHGEGDIYLGTLRTDNLGLFSGTINTIALAGNDIITAITIDTANGNTSEFGVVNTACLAGTAQVTLTGGNVQTLTNACVSGTGTSVNLTTLPTAASIPAGTSAVWYTIANPTLNTTPYATPASAAAGTYYVFYYDPAGCFNVSTSTTRVTVTAIPTPTPVSTFVNNVCPATSAALVNPSSTYTLEWHTASGNPGAGTLVPNPSAVSQGVYYLYNCLAPGCYSSASAGVVARVVSCVPGTQSLAKRAVDTTNGNTLTTVSPGATTQATVNYVLEVDASQSDAPYAMTVTDTGFSAGLSYVSGSLKLPPGWTSTTSASSVIASATAPSAAIGRFQPSTVPPINASAFSSTGGDGYNILAFGDKIYQLNHHNYGMHFECWVKATGQPCFTSTTGPSGVIGGAANGRYLVPDNTIFNGRTYTLANTCTMPTFWVDEAQQYVYTTFGYTNAASAKQGIAIVKSNIATGAIADIQDFDSAASGGIYSYGNAGAGSYGFSGLIHGAGEKLYFQAYRTGQLYCYDMNTADACASQPPTLTWNSTALAPNAYSHNIMELSNGYIVQAQRVSGGQWALFDPATNAYVKGPVNFGTTDQKGFFHTLDNAGNNNGFCFFGLTYSAASCFNMNGNSFTPSQNLNPLLSFLRLHYYDGLLDGLGEQWENIPVFGTRMYFSSAQQFGDPNGYTYCYDFATGATCPGWPLNTRPNTTSPVSVLAYTTAHDLSDPSCMWISSDNGGVWSFSAQNGGACFSFKNSAQPYFCDGKALTNRIRWAAADIKGLTPGTDYSSMIFTLLDSTGLAIKGFTGLTLSNDSVDLSAITYPTYTTGGIIYNTKRLTVSYTPVGFTAGGTSLVNAGAVQTVLSWTGDPTQICFKAVVCAENGKTVSNTARASFTNGGSVTSNTAAAAVTTNVSSTIAPLPILSSLENVCPDTTVNLNSTYPAGSLPADLVYEWHTVNSNPSAATLIDASNANPLLRNPAAVGIAGNYYLYKKSSGSGCYSIASTPVSVMIITCPSLSGNVYNDANGLNDTTVNGIGTNAGGTLFVNVVNNSGLVVAVATVAANGFFSIAKMGTGSFTLQLTGNQGSVGSVAPAVLLPSGWVNTGEHLGASKGSDAAVDGRLAVTITNVDVSNANFGVERPPVVNAYIATPQRNPGGTGTVVVPSPAFTGTDAEDGAYSTGLSGKKVTLTPGSNGDLYYNGFQVTSSQTITNFNPALVTLDPTGPMPTSVVPVTATFTYEVYDAANIPSTPKTVTLPFNATPLPVNLSKFNGTMFECTASLYWEATSEVNLSKYEIQQSRDGQRFTTIGMTLPKKAANRAYTFEYPQDGKMYYRLSIVDLDGSYSYTKTIMLSSECDGIGDITVGPSPTYGILYVGGINVGDKIRVTDATGKLIKESDATASTFPMDLEPLPSGIYTITVIRGTSILVNKKIAKH